MEGKMIVFITGGVGSGKSAFAEKLALELCNTNRPHYIATSVPTDKEMTHRIKHHQLERKKSGTSWIVWEQSTEISLLARQFKYDDTVLIDCLTTLLSNQLFHGWERNKSGWQYQRFRESIYKSIISAITAIHESSGTTIVVSNEIFSEPLPRDRTAFYYALMLGRLHQSIVGMSEQAYLVVNGIPIKMKESNDQ
jgi:adenosylcobinamide kinase/adenosylcobinamide-phosphate guanylyltransferase